MNQIVSIILLFLLFLNPVVGVSQTGDDKQKNHSQLVDVQQLVYQLRKNNKIADAVLLTKTIWQILNTFNDQSQAEQLWSAALAKTNQDQTSDSYSVVSTQFNTGQILSSYSHGMQVARWNLDRSSAQVNANNVTEFLNSYDDLTIYFHLKSIWELIIDEIAKREDIQWPTVFNDSIFIQLVDQQDLNKVITDNAGDKTQLLSELNEIFFLKDIELGNELLAVTFDKLDQLQMIESHHRLNFYYIFTRFLINKQGDNFLGAFHSWLQLAQSLSSQSDSFKKVNEKGIAKLLESNQKWLLKHQQSLLGVNIKLPELFSSSIDNLKYFLSGASDELELVSAYDLLPMDLGKYMSNPFRKDLHSNLEICLNISDEITPFPQFPIDLKQFYGCVNDFTDWMLVEAKSRQLAGTVDSAVSTQALDRALLLPAWQIINTLQSQLSTESCLQNTDQLVNPFEWSLASESILWFADRWPSYMRNSDIISTPKPANYVNPLVQINKFVVEGEKLLAGFNCLPEGKRQSLITVFSKVQQNWQQVQIDINNVKNEYVDTNLNQSSDLDLLDSFEQKSSYRVENASIKECDVKSSCGVHVELEASREIFKLFPNHLLLADQLKLNNLKLCYDNVGWESRHSTATHLDNDSVANYLGKLSFNLKGFYGEQLVFDRKVVSKQENLYLFGKNDEEVLNKYCPLDIVGDKITTKLERGTFGLVPNRLTFLTASRADESKIVKENWQQGEEWQDKIVDKDSVTVVTAESLLEHLEAVHLSYTEKSTELQNIIYNSMLQLQPDPTESQRSLSQSFAEMNRNLDILTAMYEISSDDFLTNNQLQSLLYGSMNIPSKKSVKDWRDKQLGIKQMIVLMSERLTDNQLKMQQLNDFKPWYSIKDSLFRLKQLASQVNTVENNP